MWVCAALLNTKARNRPAESPELTRQGDLTSIVRENSLMLSRGYGVRGFNQEERSRGEEATIRPSSGAGTFCYLLRLAFPFRLA